jgi:HD-GYP domain-containing protein (c-di-GMP phosphodiesterase class II)
MEARILSLADSVESMLSPKSFRPALSATDALQEIVKASGTQFDPSVVQAFLGVLQREGPTFLERPGAPVLVAAPDWGRQRVG